MPTATLAANPQHHGPHLDRSTVFVEKPREAVKKGGKRGAQTLI